MLSGTVIPEKFGFSASPVLRALRFSRADATCRVPYYQDRSGGVLSAVVTGAERQWNLSEKT
jgi:hypothetical protein